MRSEWFGWHRRQRRLIQGKEQRRDQSGKPSSREKEKAKDPAISQEGYGSPRDLLMLVDALNFPVKVDIAHFLLQVPPCIDSQKEYDKTMYCGA
ncbi:hypothetical protein NDU88_006783 [Pleurodeles waltl]|uniref:Uncharacterized protein n=1 Tax=Pleurodeles waltl TaxID=8319 RepID=A0AAV7QIV4_PLEWA|nr:hypothetical protein NDU88_006783 [Pleurodeles waltl]